jgi:putative hydrolase of the HAD superfamily
MAVMTVRKLLIWDFDGTLGYRVGGMWSAALLEVISSEATGIRVTADQLRPYLQSGFPWHMPEQPHTETWSAGRWWDALDPVFARAFEAVGFERTRAWLMAKQVRCVYPDPVRWRLFDDTLPALSQLSEAGWHHVILSNHTPELPGLVKHLSLTPHILQVFGSAQTGYEKPHPGAFQTVLDAFPEVTQLWMIGDSLQADIEGARRVGIPGILVRCHHPEARLYRPGLAEITAFLSREP